MHWSEVLKQDLENLVLPLTIFAGACLLMFVNTLFVFWIKRRSLMRQRAKEYPVTIQGWGLRMTEPPPFQATVDDVAGCLSLLLDKAVEVKGYSRKKAKAKLDWLNVTWIANDPYLVKTGAIRHIRDGYGRIISGDHQGNNIRVVYRPEDRLGHTAFVHECGHELHELEGRRDMDHEDKVMWDGIVRPVKKALRGEGT